MNTCALCDKDMGPGEGILAPADLCDECMSSKVLVRVIEHDVDRRYGSSIEHGIMSACEAVERFGEPVIVQKDLTKRTCFIYC